MNLPISTYYYQLRCMDKKLTSRMLRIKQEETHLLGAIKQLIKDNSGYGVRKIVEALRATGTIANYKRIHRIMQENKLICKPTKKYKISTTDSNHSLKRYPNVAAQVVPFAKNQLIVVDTTFLPLAGIDNIHTHCYLATVMDTY